MLVDVETRRLNPIPHPILAVISSGRKAARISQGIYQNGHWSFELEFRGRQDFTLDYPNLGEFSCYGVCDSPEQLMELLPKIVTEGPDKYVISMVNLKKADEPQDGGWRWHKWGPYIGKQEPECEYLAHEPKIEEIWTYHVYKV